MKNADRYLKKAIRLSKKFFGFDPRKIDRLPITWPKALVSLGPCSRIHYVNDKFDGKTREYFHDFDQPCIVLADPERQPNDCGMLVIIGRFKITEAGIEG